MKKIIFLFCMLGVMTSCKTQMITKSAAEVKSMTTKQFDASPDLLFKSIISLLQSESYIVESADKETGLINAYKRIQNKKAASQRFWTGSSKDANTSKAMFYVESLNKDVTEVKVTLYEGTEITQTNLWGSLNKQNTEKMVYEPKVYEELFKSLQEEINHKQDLGN